jgi:CheY-like chemotaxis protein
MNITRSLVGMMNGGIRVESEPDKGSTFTVKLPQKLDGSRAVLSRELVENLNQRRITSAAQVKKSQIIRKYMPYGSVLIVDDTEANLYVAKLLMAPYGLKIDTASSGQESIDKIKSGNVYDIIFMDHMMPLMDGIEAVKIMRGMGYTHPVIALTANAVVGQADMFLTNGFDDFISKPIDMRILDMALIEYIYDKQTPEVKAAAVAEKKKLEAQAAAIAETRQSPLSSADTLPFDIPVLNVRRGLAIFEGDRETYVAALRSFTKNVPEMLDKLRNVTEVNISEYATNVHGLKSISGWICADGIQVRAASLEILAKAGNFVGVTALNPYLIEEVETFLSNLNIQLEH